MNRFNPMSFRKWLIIPALALALGCEKKVIDVFPVLEYEERNLPVTADVHEFEMVGSNTIVAATSDGIYRSTNLGQTWAAVSTGFSGQNVTQVSFFDALNGCVLVKPEFLLPYCGITTDGGQTWTQGPNANIAGFDEAGRLITGEAEFLEVSLNASTNMGASWTTLVYRRIVDMTHEFTKAVFQGDNVYILTDEIHLEDRVQRFNLSTGALDELWLPSEATYNEIKDVYIGPSGLYACGDIGAVIIPYDQTSTIRPKTWHGHTFEAVHGFGDFVLFAGEKTMFTNMDVGTEEFTTEVFKPSLDGFEEHFLDLKFVSGSEVYLSGKGGLFWRANI